MLYTQCLYEVDVKKRVLMVKLESILNGGAGRRGAATLPGQEGALPGAGCLVQSGLPTAQLLSWTQHFSL